MSKTELLCSKCEEQKPHRSHAWCRTCLSSYTRNWRAEHKEHHKSIRTKNSLTYLSNPVNKVKHAAREMVRRAVKRGELAKPDVCDVCGSNPGVNSVGQSNLRSDHFKGYERTNWLVVRWLCITCDGVTRRQYE